MIFFGSLFSIFTTVVHAVASIVRAVVTLIWETIKFIAKQALHAYLHLRDGTLDWRWDYILFKHLSWKRLILNAEERDKEIDRLLTDLEDSDYNGIPDLYDREITRPEDDFLHIKYPEKTFRENDYVRYLPRGLKNLILDPQPVSMGAKGLVRSETVNNQGAYAWVKWNRFSRGEGSPSILYRVNQMDLALMGHVHDSYRVTQ
jgi:hypothetical protein